MWHELFIIDPNDRS